MLMTSVLLDYFVSIFTYSRISCSYLIGFPPLCSIFDCIWIELFGNYWTCSEHFDWAYKFFIWKCWLQTILHARTSHTHTHKKCQISKYGNNVMKYTQYLHPSHARSQIVPVRCDIMDSFRRWSDFPDVRVLQCVSKEWAEINTIEMAKREEVAWPTNYGNLFHIQFGREMNRLSIYADVKN